MNVNERDSAFSGRSLSKCASRVACEIRDGDTRVKSRNPLCATDSVLLDAEPSSSHVRPHRMLTGGGGERAGRWSRSHIRHAMTVGVGGAVHV